MLNCADPAKIGGIKLHENSQLKYFFLFSCHICETLRGLVLVWEKIERSGTKELLERPEVLWETKEVITDEA